MKKQDYTAKKKGEHELKRTRERKLLKILKPNEVIKRKEKIMIKVDRVEKNQKKASMLRKKALLKKKKDLIIK